MRSVRWLAMACVMLLAGCVSAQVPPLPKPPKVEIAPTTTSIPDFSGTSLPVVKGTTTTSGIKMTGGKASIHGRVLSGGVPASGAVVRIERFVGDLTTSTDVVAAADGGYGLNNVLGGRYRVRAFRPPTETMTQAQVLFVAASESRSLDLALEHVEGAPVISTAVAPDPPVLGQAANVVVRVTMKGVDSGGIARSIAVQALPIRLNTAGGRLVTTVNPTVTDSNGRATWGIVCVSLDRQALSVTLQDGTTHAIDLAACQLPVTTTTEPVGLIPQ